jgi:uncharacterized cupredoxin-like copper-binding protein
MSRMMKLWLALLALTMFVPTLAQEQEVIRGEDFNWEAVEPYGDVETTYEPYEVAEAGAIILTHTTPGDQHANFDVVGPDGYWEHFDFSDDPGEERILDELLPGVYSIAATDEGLELAHTVVEVRAGESTRIHVSMGIWEEGGYVAGTYDPYGYYGVYEGYEGVYPGYPYGVYGVGPYAPYPAGAAGQLGAFAVDANVEDATYVVTGPNGYSEDFEGDFVAEALWPGVYAIAATREGYDTAVTTVEIQPEMRLEVVPVLVTAEGTQGQNQNQQNQQNQQQTTQQGEQQQTVQVGLTEYQINMPNEVSAGMITFEVTNNGTVEHNFEIEGQGIEQVFDQNLQPGETRSMTVELQPGTYEVYCPVGDHAEQGMRLELTVIESQ